MSRDTESFVRAGAWISRIAAARARHTTMSRTEVCQNDGDHLERDAVPWTGNQEAGRWRGPSVLASVYSKNARALGVFVVLAYCAAVWTIIIASIANLFR
jgi:hypothetical protein